MRVRAIRPAALSEGMPGAGGRGHGGACACAPFVARACAHTGTRGRRRTCACLGMTAAGGEAPGRPRPASNFPLSPPPLARPA